MAGAHRARTRRRRLRRRDPSRCPRAAPARGARGTRAPGRHRAARRARRGSTRRARRRVRRPGVGGARPARRRGDQLLRTRPAVVRALRLAARVARRRRALQSARAMGVATRAVRRLRGHAGARAARGAGARSRRHQRRRRPGAARPRRRRCPPCRPRSRSRTGTTSTSPAAATRCGARHPTRTAPPTAWWGSPTSWGSRRWASLLDATALDSMLRKFEHGVALAATSTGTRVVKLLGDEAMFVSGSPEEAAAIRVRWWAIPNCRSCAWVSRPGPYSPAAATCSVPR